MRTLALEIYNPECTPPITRLDVSLASIEPIMTWYRVFHAGDEYVVKVNGLEVLQDLNGRLEYETIDA